mgnify:FL=1
MKGVKILKTLNNPEESEEPGEPEDSEKTEEPEKSVETKTA